MAHREKFTLRSGNTTSFKDMGSSPLKEPVTLIVSGAIAAASAIASAAAAKAKANAAKKAKAEDRASEATKKSGDTKFASEETSKISEGTNETTTPKQPTTPEQPTVETPVAEEPESTAVVGGKSAGDGGLSGEEKEKLGTN